jgi:hypothetical protein
LVSRKAQRIPSKAPKELAPIKQFLTISSRRGILLNLVLKMSIRSLSSLALSRLPVVDYSTLVREGYLVPQEFGAWETWRERAMKDFAISGEYFDLPLHDYPRIGRREARAPISPEYRYLEIQTKFYLSPESAVSLSPDGEINGIYESLTGVYECLRRNDEEMVLFFAQRLRGGAISRITSDIQSGRILHMVPNYRPGGYDVFYFRTLALRTLADYLYPGRGKERLRRAGLYPQAWQIRVEEDAKDGTLRPEKYGNKGNTKLGLLYLVSLGRRDAYSYITSRFAKPAEVAFVEEDLFRISASDIGMAVLASGDLDLFEEGKRHVHQVLRGSPPVSQVLRDIPLFLSGVVYESGKVKVPIDPKFYEAVVYGGNPRILIYMKGFFNTPISSPRSVIFSGYYTHNNPQGFFSVTTFFAGKYLAFISSDLDISYHAWSIYEREEELAQYVVERNLGYVEEISTFYPLLSSKNKREAKQRAEGAFPLSSRIMQTLDGLPDLTD